MKYEELPTDAREALNEVSKDIITKIMQEKGLAKKAKERTKNMKELTLEEAIEALKQGKKIRLISPIKGIHTFHLDEKGDFVDDRGNRGIVAFGLSQYETCYNISDFEKALNKKRFILVEEDILDKEEKEYLGNIVRPFKGKYKEINIVKIKIGGEYFFISIKLSSKDTRCINFPLFSKNDTMYRGMEPNKQYTLEELGL